MKLFVCFMVVALSGSTVECARKVNAKELLEQRLSELGGHSHRAKREARRMSVRSLMGAGPETDLQVKHVSQTALGTKLWKMEETFRGKPVYDAQLTVETDSSGAEVIDATGTYVEDIDKDTDGSIAIYPNEALYNVLQEFGDSRENIRDIKMEQNVFIDDDEQAFTGYRIEYRVEDQDVPKRPTAIVHGQSGKVMMSWNSLTTFCAATGVGGNEKVGEVSYDGIDYDCLNVTVVENTCYLENDDVRVVNMESTKFFNITEAMSYDCANANDSINGAYSPALDAFYIGTAAHKMFREWYNMSKILTNEKLIIRVHYGEEYPNAFWNGVNTTFGDGRGGFHPFVSVDLVGHELGHALIEQQSGLIWFRQPGAINEAFADITGEVLEHYIKGHDWLTGYDITKDDFAVRYFEDPTENIMAISNFNHFSEFMEPHETGGILAHAFYRIVEEYNQTMKQAYQVFLHANENYWHHFSSITSGVCDLMKSAYDLGQPMAFYQAAFEAVGVEVCNITQHIVGLSNNETRGDIHVSNSTRPFFTFGFPGVWTRLIFVKAYSSHGPVHITVTNGTWTEAYNPDFDIIQAEGDDYAAFNLTDIDQSYVTVTLSSSSEDLWTDVTVKAGFTCVGTGETVHAYYDYHRKLNCEEKNYDR